MRVRAGPFSLSSRSGAGLHAGPFSTHTGTSGCGSLLAFLLVAAAIGAAIQYWYITVPALLLIGVAAYFVLKAASEANEEATKAWLAAPPPPLEFPGRVTEKWLASNVPALHPGQVSTLWEELRARGWPEDRIEERVGRYLASNPYVSESMGLRY